MVHIVGAANIAEVNPALLAGGIARLEKSAEHIAFFNSLLSDDSVGEIMLNKYDSLFVERHGVLQKIDYNFETREHVQLLAEYILKLCDRDSESGQYIDGMLPDGSRVAVVMPPSAVNGANIAVRKRCKHMLTLDDMVSKDILPLNVATLLKGLAKSRATILVSGSTSSGKTTLLNALSEYINESERIITIEDAAELNIQHQNVVRLESSENGMSQRDLVKSAMRLRGDRIIMGELRGAECLDFLQAINTGHHGSMGTIHANNPRDAFMRLEMMINMSGSNLSARFIHQQIASSLNIIIQAQRSEDGKRCVTHITEVIGLEGDTIIAQDLFVRVVDPRTQKASYQFSNFSSRNAKIQEAINASKQVMVK
jgi:pilus assembly protein CpaF